MLRLTQTPAARYYSDTARPVLRPAMDVIERADGIVIYMDLPGLAPDDVTVEVEGDLLTISGESHGHEEAEGDRYQYRERRTGAFKRTLRLADTLDTGSISATFDNGVLSLSLPRRPETQPKRIPVNMAQS
jgi:HSP20 family protein